MRALLIFCYILYICTNICNIFRNMFFFFLFIQVSHCPATRRIAVGGRGGQLALYELRGNVKCQTVSAHSAPVTALAFSPEGKFLVSYSCSENKLCFWQVSKRENLLHRLTFSLHLCRHFNHLLFSH